MASLESLQVKALKAQNVALQVGTDSPIAVRLTYKGTGTVTSVTVTTATNIVMVTSDGGTDTYAFATYDTVGKLVDAINADGIFEAKVLDTLRSLATASQFVDGAISSSVVEGVSVWDVLVDTSAADYFAIRLCADRDPDTVKTGKRVKLAEVKYGINLGTADRVKIYEVDGAVEKLLLNEAAVDTTDTQILFASGQKTVDASYGRDLVVYIKDGGNLADAATNYLRVVGTIE